jgi:prepilin-type N-terminal cleavage/methylation domain-containing protein
MRRARDLRGFTLVELLVAISIIAVLAGLLTVTVGAARRSTNAKATKAQIERIKLACEAYSTDFGDYPPTSLAALGAPGNGTNEGIESLLRCLTTRREKGPYLELDERDLVNTDGDGLARPDPTGSTIAARELFEVADAWGNPLIYFHHRDYQGGARIERYCAATGDLFNAKPRPSGKTGSYPAVSTFLVWSAGADGVNENGEGDDVCSWK